MKGKQEVMYGSWDGRILGCDGSANIIDAVYVFESSASRLMRLKWRYPEALESISRSGVRLDIPSMRCTRGYQQLNSLEIRCLL